MTDETTHTQDPDALQSAPALGTSAAAPTSTSGDASRDESVPAEAPDTTDAHLDPGPKRHEDTGEPLETSAEEVDLEEQRKDETSSMAHDRYRPGTSERITEPA